jgi:peptidoglycan hydrolase-like protein with peptidoglycan-binding domain
MDPTEIARLLASGDKEQIKQAQKQLQALGFDIGPGGADGAPGKQTMAASQAHAEAEAAKAAKRERQDERQAEIDLINAQGLTS